MTIGASAAVSSTPASAMELDWSGQFRAESNLVRGYAKGNGPNDPRPAAGGYSIRGGGSESAQFQTLFLRLMPKLVVNDNIYIKSEWWLGNPVYGFYGDSFPGSSDQRQFYSNQSRGATVTAQRFWAEFLTDIGTVQVGRAPLNWGLGLVWSAGDGIFDRYESTGDTLRLISKFGAFSFIPAITKYSMGNSVGGGCTFNAGTVGTTGACTPGSGGAGLSDYSLALKYENPDEEFEGGVNFIKRVAGAAQDPASGVIVPTLSTNPQGTGGMNFNTFDLYGKKKLGKLSLAAELPVVSGDLGGSSYKTFAVATEIKWKPNDTFELNSKLGHAPGQGNIQGTQAEKFKAFFFNPNYRLGLIMFNYQLANFAGVQTTNNPGATSGNLSSPYDNPIVNANYLALGGTLHAEKWHFRTNFITAKASESAGASGNFYNYWTRKYVANTTGKAQDKGLGSEIDFGTSFHWDETFQFHFDFGWYYPGDFYRFSNALAENANPTIFGASLKAGVAF
ncbi:MAG: hypothetical protein H7222_04875 [Methylotenera sp.]|nr:hypothetical protein [Oligoflexia bacterium]